MLSIVDAVIRMSRVLLYIGALLLILAIALIYGVYIDKPKKQTSSEEGSEELFGQPKYIRTQEEEIKQIKLDISRLYKVCEGIDIKHKAHTLGRGALFERVVKVSGDHHLLSTKVQEVENVVSQLESDMAEIKGYYIELIEQYGKLKNEDK